ncbi:uncharacterized protein K460DRAFT_406479 [Cucurbitaria berberidis CBS 394.84]|uniref:Uncharacterized protein n=1 Tax=Cucurbitaria berberidis CBS 394.84 TaxID=1168544 RepID=A0A9P4L9B8_9PLEO|nr:uncharacterized protein K460DRAFT_406479 [Cucurbitaria berberidis CBS 394.84]KAF1846263.1 hypothetical protein K460DRAFT_406479 [Cucurbitaria berberidis CBS 394.84]
MCKYIYAYSSTCQHGELTRVTYCNKATALGLPKHDSHSPNGAGVDNTPGAQPGPSSSHPPTSSANNSSSSSPHTQQQHYSNMSTISPSKAGTPLAWSITATERNEQVSPQAAFVPRSAINDNYRHQASGSANANSELDTQGYRNIDMDIPLDTQSSLSMGFTHDGKVTELVARFESYAGCSDASEVSPIGHARIHGDSNRSPTQSDTDTVRQPPKEHVQFETDNHTIGHTAQGQQSPRKPIPSQWFPKSNAPNLATAQRAKERSHKKGSHSGSPVEVRTLRGTRSSVDLGKRHNAEGATFLTKEALAAVDSNITSPTSPCSPNRLHRSPSKPSWQSPNASPLRSSLRQQSTVTNKVSPTRPTYLNAETALNAHSRAASSVATSTGGNSFHTAEDSPVRSPVGSELSFWSAEEIIEDMDIPYHNLTADSETVQTGQGSSNVSTLKGKSTGKTSSIKPKLALTIPPSGSSSSTDHDSVVALTSATSKSETIVSPWSLTSPIQTSRIPRVATKSQIGRPSGATRSSTLKKAQSAKCLIAKAKSQQEQTSALPQISRADPSTVQSLLHTYTINSPDSTTLFSHISAVDKVAHACDAPAHAELSPALAPRHTSDKLTLNSNETALADSATSVDDCISGRTSSATSATVKASPALEDPVLIDSAVIYSRKKSDAFGTMLEWSINVLSFIFMMAHTLDLGTVHVHDIHDDAASVASSYAGIAHNDLAVRGRTDRYAPSARRQVESETSMQSSLGSDLRATAPAFVPQATQQTYPASSRTEETTLLRPDQEGLFPDLSSLDQHGVPWFYYMYPIHFAYEQGFRNGRSRSPKKFKPRKQRESISSPTATQHVFQNANTSVAGFKPAATPLSEVLQRQPSAVLMPLPPVPSHELQEPVKQENSHPGLTAEQKVANIPCTNESSIPFSTQIDLITQQAALRNDTDNKTQRFANMDLTTIRNVGLPLGPRNMCTPSYYAFPRRNPRQGYRHTGNGLYGGRGAAGVPMHATAPFPDPVPPPSRPLQNQQQVLGGSSNNYMGYSIGTEACGRVDIDIAVERGGGDACNTCEPDH